MKQFFDASQCGLPVSTFVKPYSFDDMVYDFNIMLTIWIIICNYIRDAFGKRAILPEEEVQNLGTGYMEAE